jgi:uncharacterized membrane protein
MLGASAILTGLLPFAHVHAFFAVMGTWGWLAMVQSVRRRTPVNSWVGFWILALALAAPQVVWQFAGSYSNRFSHWQVWWLKPPGENPALFWFRNLGMALPLGAWALFWTWRTRASKGFHFHYYLALLVLFALTNIYLFQPNVWDNMKFMVFSYLVLAMYLGYTLSRWTARYWWSTTGVVVIVLSLSLPGALSIARESQISWRFSTPEEIQVAKIFRRVVPPEARVLTSDQHNHFVPVLTGRRIVMGYRGWLWSYGVDYGQVERDIAAMYAGGADAEGLLRKYGVSYVVIGPSERDLLHPNEEYFKSRYAVALQSGAFVVYRVN